MEQTMWFALVVIAFMILIASARVIRLWIFPDTTRHDLAVCKDRIREVEYRLGHVLQELREIRTLLERQQTSGAARKEQGITTPPEKLV